MRVLHSLSLIFIFGFGLSVSAAQSSVFAKDCEGALAPEEKLASFVIDMVERGELVARVLESLVEDDRGYDRFLQTLARRPLLQTHFAAEYSRLSEIQLEAFREQIRAFLLADERQERERSDAEMHTENAIDFVYIRKGTVQIPYALEYRELYREAYMDSDLEVMTTHVTFKMFKEIVGIDLMAPGDQPEFPIRSVTIWMAMFFANRLSEKMGLQPVYNLPKLSWNSEGDLLNADSDQPLKDVVVENEPKAHKRMGFRLPKTNEWEFILGSIEQKLKWEVTGPDTLVLQSGSHNLQYYWSFDNARDQLKAVGSRESLTVRGEELFDLYGLLKHWMHPVSYNKLTLMNTGTYRSSFPILVSSGLKPIHEANATNIDFGFRLVREVSR